MFPIMGATNPTGYNLTRSLRFRSSASAYLSRTPATTTNRRTWTVSCWIKRGRLATGTEQVIFSSNNGSTYTELNYLASSDVLRLNLAAGGSAYYFDTSAVFRDPSAWYHIVVAVDTTQSTSTDRMKVYINGVQQTGSNNAPAQNYDTDWNRAQNAFIGSRTASTWFNDCYLAEFYNIDGLQLTPSSFGSTNTLTGVWQPARYTGTYGTNGFYLPFNYQSASAYAGSFNGTNQYLSLAQNSAFNFGTGDFTVETWVYANSWSSVNPIICLGDGAIGGGSPLYTGWALRYSTSSGLGWYRYDGTETHLTNNIFLATNQWICLAVSRSSGVLKMFVNGAQVYSAANTTSYNNVNSNTLKIGGNWTIGGPTVTWFNGYISNVRIVNNTGLYTANYAPPTTNLTAVSGTALLTLQNSSIVDNSTNAFTITNNNSVSTSLQNIFGAPILTADQSGNSNNWQSYNISLASGTTYDSMTDVPTLTSATAANFATLNPIGVPYNTGTASGGNLNWTGASAADKGMAGTIAMDSGKWYWECVITATAAGSSSYVGIAKTAGSADSNANKVYLRGDGYLVKYGSSAGPYTTFTTGDIIGVAYDYSAQTLSFYKNNTLNVTATGINLESNLPWVGGYTTTESWSVNFGQRPFTYTPPTGYVALNTYNLPTSTIVKGNTVMDATLYTGNGTNQTITNAGAFKPDLVWVKCRSLGYSNYLEDSVRGVGKDLSSNSTAAEATYNLLTSFNSNGFTVSTSSGTYLASNDSGQTFVGWQWQAGQGTNTSNTNGTITSTVSVNASAGFSVVTYTVPASGSFTVGHGLGVAPSFVIHKSRSNVIGWPCYHASIGNGVYINLDLTNPSAASSTAFGNTSPSSTVINYGNTSFWGAGYTYVAYCFAPIAGYSAFGSYTGNGSTDGPFVYTGFLPRWVMVKRTDASGTNWDLYDTARNPYNAMDLELFPNSSSAEYNGGRYFDFLSNGFKPRTTVTDSNASGGTYIYAAFATNPFKNALAR